MDPPSVNGTSYIRLPSVRDGVPEATPGQVKGTPISRAKDFVERDQTPQSDYASLKEAAQTFESLFVIEVLREMEKTLGEGSMFGGSIEGRTYGDLIRWELAKNISSQSSLGIADALVQQLGPLVEQSSGKAESSP
jgi:Rod binding domain-containing protein